MAKSLLPPEKPQAGSNWQGCLVVIATIVICVCAGLTISSFLYQSLDSLIVSLDSNNPIEPTRLLLGFIPILIFLIPALGILVLMVFLYRATSASYKKKFAEVTEELPRWEHAVQRWEQAYYCYRDDVIFIYGEDKTASLSQARKFFYE